jgi:serine/threonine protein kinase
MLLSQVETLCNLVQSAKPTMSNREDKKIGKYRITNKRLGSGQFATVYEGYDATDQTKVAIKVMERSKIEANEKLVRSLDLEVSMSTKLRHKNLVQAIALYVSVNHTTNCQIEKQKFLLFNFGKMLRWRFERVPRTRQVTRTCRKKILTRYGRRTKSSTRE